MALRPAAGDSDAFAALRARALGLTVLDTYHSALSGFAASMGPAARAVLAADPLVKSIEPNRPISAFGQIIPTGVERVHVHPLGVDTDLDFLHEASPLTHVGQLRAPLFIIHGANDPRVPLSEAGDYIAGYTIANDFGLHDFRDTDAGSMLRVKGSDTMAPLGPGLVTGWDFHGKRLRTYVNGRHSSPRGSVACPNTRSDMPRNHADWSAAGSMPWPSSHSR